jgi:hypothetical protein
MSSPGGSKGHRQAQPLSEDYYTPVAEMETNHILKSTFTVRVDKRMCLTTTKRKWGFIKKVGFY